MFDQITEYSSDVEWLLQDKQAKEHTILNALVPEHFERTLQLGFLISLDPQEAVLFTCETFADALLSRHRYSSDQDVQEWLDQILINRCQESQTRGSSVLFGGISQENGTGRNEPTPEAELETHLWGNLNSLSHSDRLPYMLHSIFFIPVPQVARLLGLKDGVADARLETTRKLLLTGLNGRTVEDHTLDDEKICDCLIRSFQKRWESERLVPEAQETMIAAIQTLVEDKRRERRRRVILQEILLVVVVVVFVFALVQVAAYLSADPSAGQTPPAFLNDLLNAIL
jgi:hypothetical protein